MVKMTDKASKVREDVIECCCGINCDECAFNFNEDCPKAKDIDIYLSQLKSIILEIVGEKEEESFS